MAVTTQSMPSSSQLRRLAPTLRPATAKALNYCLDPDGSWYPTFRHNRVAQLKVIHQVNHLNRQRKAQHIHSFRRRWDLVEEDDEDLAHSLVPLPGDGSRNKPPQLERQEAFRGTRPRRSSDDDETDQIASLYRLGILYDDEHARGSGFGLDAIVHDAPVYSVRPSKRFRKASEASHFQYQNLSLPLELSFSSFGGDEAIAQFLAPDLDELSSIGDECESTPNNEKDVDSAPAAASSSTVAPLTVIYELDEVSISSPAPAPAATEYPDLISDTEECEFEDEDGNEDWAVLGPIEAEISSADIDAGDEETAVSAEAWIMLGDDS